MNILLGPSQSFSCFLNIWKDNWAFKVSGKWNQTREDLIFLCFYLQMFNDKILKPRTMKHF